MNELTWTEEPFFLCHLVTFSEAVIEPPWMGVWFWMNVLFSRLTLTDPFLLAGSVGHGGKLLEIFFSLISVDRFVSY